ncbi:ImmA/IrrE family metallo-endopeptidase [Corynebacterium sp. AOP40-9SA-29]|uniref:ImmA/IrrE family metallo-endopeptidase n=1 Tax=Corynebacterium sp. AOP40-9SA-29 TaxID=3457677 RepID=UPI004033AA8A
MDSNVDDLLNELVEDVELVQRLTSLADAPVTPNTWDKPSTGADSEKMAARIRRELNVNAPVTGLVDRLENVNFLAFSRPLGDDTADGGTVLLERGGVSIINSSRKVGRRRLTAVHELCHFLVGDDYTVDWRVADNTDQTEA